MPLENVYLLTSEGPIPLLLTFLKRCLFISFGFLRYHLYIVDNILYIYGFHAELYSESLSSISG